MPRAAVLFFCLIVCFCVVTFVEEMKLMQARLEDKGLGLFPCFLLSCCRSTLPFPTHLKTFSNKFLYAKSCCTPFAAANFKHSSIMSQTP